jgi:hypothetical protein
MKEKDCNHLKVIMFIVRYKLEFTRYREAKD